MPTNIHFRSVHFSHDFCICRKNRELVSHPQKLDLFLHNRLFHSGSYIRACQVRAVDFFMPTGTRPLNGSMIITTGKQIQIPNSSVKNATANVVRSNASSAVLSAEPLCSYAQMTSAKLVIELPSAENVCVDHRRRNGSNAVRAGLSQSFGENLNAENFFWKF